jgi:hypothetical protein
MKISRKIYLVLITLFGQVAIAHDGAVQINNNECSGVYYQAGIWDESSRIGQRTSNRSSQSLATCNDIITEDNCGQFELAFNFSENFCAIHTDNRKQAIYNATSHTFYYGPGNFIIENNRINYSLAEGVNFSCNVCANNENIQFENSNNQPKEYFSTGEDIFLHWSRSSPHPTASPYNSYKIESQKRSINSNSPFQLVAQTNITTGAFGRIELTSQLPFEACQEYNIVLSVEDIYGLWADTSHTFEVFDSLLCPRVAESAPVDRFRTGN